MKRYLKVDFNVGFSSICDTKEEVMEGCGYCIEEITWDDFLKEIEGDFDVIEIKGCTVIRFLTED